jgi:hypothetical protein
MLGSDRAQAVGRAWLAREPEVESLRSRHFLKKLFSQYIQIIHKDRLFGSSHLKGERVSRVKTLSSVDYSIPAAKCKHSHPVVFKISKSKSSSR